MKFKPPSRSNITVDVYNSAEMTTLSLLDDSGKLIGLVMRFAKKEEPSVLIDTALHGDEEAYKYALYLLYLPILVHKASGEYSNIMVNMANYLSDAVKIVEEKLYENGNTDVGHQC